MDKRATLIAILGAGRATRFGGGKLDAGLRGQPLGLWAFRTAQQLGGPIVYVTGPQPPRFLAATDHLADVIVNDAPERGMGHSLALAAAHARSAGAQQLLVMLGDMPFVSRASLERLCAAVPLQGAAACRYPDGASGPPACFDAALFSELEQLAGDRGGRSVLNNPDRAVQLRIDAAELRDVDSRDALAALNRE